MSNAKDVHCAVCREFTECLLAHGVVELHCGTHELHQVLVPADDRHLVGVRVRPLVRYMCVAPALGSRGSTHSVALGLRGLGVARDQVVCLHALGLSTVR